MGLRSNESRPRFWTRVRAVVVVGTSRRRWDFGYDASGCLEHVLMLPEPQDEPSTCLQMRIRISVTPYIVENLVLPPRCIRLRPCSMNGTAVPKTAVNKDRNLQTDEGDVGTARHAGQPPVDAVPQPLSMHGRAKSTFAGRIPLPCGLQATSRRSGRRGGTASLLVLPRRRSPVHFVCQRRT